MPPLLPQSIKLTRQDLEQNRNLYWFRFPLLLQQNPIIILVIFVSSCFPEMKWYPLIKSRVVTERGLPLEKIKGKKKKKNEQTATATATTWNLSLFLCPSFFVLWFFVFGRPLRALFLALYPSFLLSHLLRPLFLCTLIFHFHFISLCLHIFFSLSLSLDWNSIDCVNVESTSTILPRGRPRFTLETWGPLFAWAPLPISFVEIAMEIFD